MFVHAGRGAFCARACGQSGGAHDEWGCVGRAVPRRGSAGSRQSRRGRARQVEQDRVVAVRVGEPEGFFAAAGEIRGEAVSLQKIFEQKAVGLPGVLDPNARGAGGGERGGGGFGRQRFFGQVGGAAGNSNENSSPPVALSTAISPPGGRRAAGRWRGRGRCRRSGGSRCHQPGQTGVRVSGIFLRESRCRYRARARGGARRGGRGRRSRVPGDGDRAGRGERGRVVHEVDEHPAEAERIAGDEEGGTIWASKRSSRFVSAARGGGTDAGLRGWFRPGRTAGARGRGGPPQFSKGRDYS